MLFSKDMYAFDFLFSSLGVEKLPKGIRITVPIRVSKLQLTLKFQKQL